MADAPDGVQPATGHLQDKQATFKGKAYTFRFSFLAVAALKEAWGIAWHDDAEVISRALGGAITDVPVMLWALTRSHHPDLTREEIAKLCDDEGLTKELGDFARVANETIRAGWGAPKKKEERAAGNQPKAVRSRKA